MDWIHCNSCWMRPIEVKNQTFSITSCGHIFCDVCVKAGNKSGNDTCKTCGRECSRRVLDADVGSDIQQFFADSREILKKALDVLSFQNGHRERLSGYLFSVWSPYFSKLITSNRLSLRQNKPSSSTPTNQSYISPPTGVNSYRVANISTPVTPGSANNSPSYSDLNSPRTPALVNYFQSGRAVPQSSNVSPTLMNLNSMSLNSQQKTNSKCGAKYFERTIT